MRYAYQITVTRRFGRIPLQVKHKKFLDLVGSHGEGSVSLIENNNVAEIVLDNSEKRNAMSGRMMRQLVLAVDKLVENSLNSSISCVIIRSSGTGAKKMFCSGLDLKLASEVVNNPHTGTQMCKMMTDTLNELRQSHLISLAVLSGPAVGGGAELATSCDFRVMAHDSYCQFIHGKLGASPGWGGLNRLVSIVGRNKALSILLSSQKLQADEALKLNFIESIIPESHDSLSWALNFLKPYYSHPYPNALKTIKKAVANCDEFSAYSKVGELFAFQDRWGSKENKSALNDKENKEK